jgi:hypothetical protein
LHRILKKFHSISSFSVLLNLLLSRFLYCRPASLVKRVSDLDHISLGH